MRVELEGKWEADRIADVLAMFAQSCPTHKYASWAKNCAMKLHDSATQQRDYWKGRAANGKAKDVGFDAPVPTMMTADELWERHCAGGEA